MGHCSSSQPCSEPTRPTRQNTDDSSKKRCKGCKGGVRDDWVASSMVDMRKVPGHEKRMQQMGVPWAASVGRVCRTGKKPHGGHCNQDSWFVRCSETSSSVYGVFDGHGVKGHLVSDHVKQLLPKMLPDSLRRQGCNRKEEAGIAAFESLHESVLQQTHLGAVNSGTTATVVMHDHASESLDIFSVGDSSAALLSRNEHGGLIGRRLTVDHKPEDPKERARIEAAGGSVRFDGYCHRVVKRFRDEPGLNMSRSIGDKVAHKVCGVSAKPDCHCVQLKSEDVALLICSDGIWEVLSEQEAADIIAAYSYKGPQMAAMALADEAQLRWEVGTRGTTIDDITVLLVALGPSDSASTELKSDASTATTTFSIDFDTSPDPSWSECSSD